MTIGTRLRQLREKKRLSQQEVADYLGIGQSTYSQWESDQCTFKVDFLVPLSTLFSISVNQLVAESPTVEIPQNKSSEKDTSPESVKLLTELLESKNDLIRLLKEENERLRTKIFK